LAGAWQQDVGTAFCDLCTLLRSRQKRRWQQQHLLQPDLLHQLFLCNTLIIRQAAPTGLRLAEEGNSMLSILWLRGFVRYANGTSPSPAVECSGAAQLKSF
jgi:hypothetical protein